MERFLLIMRLDTIKADKQETESLTEYDPVMEKWIRSLRESGNYSSGSALSMNNQYVGKDLVISDYVYNGINEGISGYDVILAENLDEAISIVKTCPLVLNGIVLYEVRLIVPLIR
jgi:hypothetical protein